MTLLAETYGVRYMKIQKYEKDKLLYCRFKGHDFELERDDHFNSERGLWYMIVIGKDGSYSCDGWIRNSHDYTAKQAMIAACDGALLEPPKRWHALNS